LFAGGGLVFPAVLHRKEGALLMVGEEVRGLKREFLPFFLFLGIHQDIRFGQEFIY
jgi:hypothetical protein